MSDTCPACGNDRDNPKHYTSRCAGDMGCYCEDAFHNDNNRSHNAPQSGATSTIGDLSALSEAATPAPWIDTDFGNQIHDIEHEPVRHGEHWDYERVAAALMPADAALIVALRNAYADGDLITREEANAEQLLTAEHWNGIADRAIDELMDALTDAAGIEYHNNFLTEANERMADALDSINALATDNNTGDFATMVSISSLSAHASSPEYRTQLVALQAERDEAVKMAEWLAAELGKVAYDDNETKVAACYRWFTTAREAVRGSHD